MSIAWRPEDDADLPAGWTWRRSCFQCFGPMPTDEKGDFCSDSCRDQYEEDVTASSDSEMPKKENE